MSRFGYHSGGGAAVPLTDLLSEQVLTGTQTTITFSGFSVAFNHLVIEAFCRSDDAGSAPDVTITLNADATAGNYHQQVHSAINAVHSSAETVSNRVIGTCLAGADLANSFAWNSIFIPEYTNDKVKLIRSRSSDARGAASIGLQERLVKWTGVASITSITLDTTGDFIADSSFRLWGVL